MTIISGEIETLKSLRKVLSDNNIQQFNSIAEINEFKKNYGFEKNKIPHNVEQALQEEVDGLKIILSEQQRELDKKKKEVNYQIQQKIDHLKEKKETLQKTKSKISFLDIFIAIRSRYLSRKLNKLKINSNKILKKKLSKYKYQLNEISKKIHHIETNKDDITHVRIKDEIVKLKRIRDIVDDSYPLIAGAIGENAVVTKLSELSDDYYLINDFKTEFNPPIFDKKTHEKIFSIQIDHILVSKAGIFSIETKNWNQKSLTNIDIRSPVSQIYRSSYALFVLLNSFTSDLELDAHHWGRKSVPVRNIMAMTNAKPRKEFKNVKILKLNELNGYIQYFDDLFSANEVDILIDFLKANNTNEQ